MDVQQCMKLSLTNSPIGLIVLIDQCSSRCRKAAKMKYDVFEKTIASRMSPLLHRALGSHTGQRPSPIIWRAVRRAAAGRLRSARQDKTKAMFRKSSFSTCSDGRLSEHQHCLYMTWWSLRGGCTRSLSEHGRETPLRQWYSVSRRGRVGRCQVL